MDTTGWNQSILEYPESHVFQTTEWSEIKVKYGWSPLPFEWKLASGRTARGQALERTVSLLPGILSARVMYVPRGPLGCWNSPEDADEVLTGLEKLATTRKAIFIKIDPEIISGRGIPEGSENSGQPFWEDIQRALTTRGWVFSREQVQFRNSMWIDLKRDDMDILAGMKQKTRYNIKLSEKKGVMIRQGTAKDLETLFQLYARTSLRDGFTIRGEQYYLDVWMKFMDAGMATPLIAEFENKVLAGLFLFHFGKKAWYLYGMSSDEHRELMPNYGLQWEAIRLSKSLGCEIYDLWGAPDDFTGEDRMEGVFRFKQGLGGEVIRLIGAWDYPVNSDYYSFYTRVLPKVLGIMRKIGKRATVQEGGG